MAKTWFLPALYAFTIGLGAFLLFVLQPLQGKVLLPVLGGSPVVWNVCMVFFQGVLLLGYLYAHLLVTKLSLRAQLAIHGTVLALPLAFLPPMVPEALVEIDLLTKSPLLWLILALALSCGLGYFAVSATSPLLQAWFARSGHKSAGNPYVLYVASNAGSLAALLSYPFLVEPSLRLREQLWAWAGGYLLLVLALSAVGLWLFRRGASEVASGAEVGAAVVNEEGSKLEEATEEGAAFDIDAWVSARPAKVDSRPEVTWRQRLAWIALAFVPSSLMLGVTNFITTDVAAMPLLWMPPLALYLTTFLIVFGRYGETADRLIRLLLPIALAGTLLLILVDTKDFLWFAIAWHLLGFFLAALACHGRLALLKPAPRHLTGFYLCLSFGGVLGGMFNTFVAPHVFSNIVEYPLMVAVSLVICGALAPREEKEDRFILWLGSALALGMGMAVMSGFTKWVGEGGMDATLQRFTDSLSLSTLQAIAGFGIPLLFSVLLLRRTFWAGAALLGSTLMALNVSPNEIILHRERSIFGVLTVSRYFDPDVNALVHGGILHGEQRIDSDEARREPRSYYHRRGPLGQIFEAVEENEGPVAIGAIGLGAGTIAAYGHEDNEIVFFELDPNVERLARDRRYFTYVDDCLRRGCNLSVVIGDGRLGLMRTPRHFDLIVVDAFSSDAIPVHLITLEALQTYLSRLKPGGLVAFHISNRFIDLEPVLYNLAKALDLGYAVRSDEESAEDENDPDAPGTSTWVILARENGAFDRVVADQRWRGLAIDEKVGIWRDDYANVIRTFLWR